MATRYYSRSRQKSDMAREAESLLIRHPNLSEQELARLIDILPRLPILDMGLMTADDRLSEKLAAFHRHHGDKLRAPTAALMWFLAFPIIAAIGALWWIIG